MRHPGRTAGHPPEHHRRALVRAGARRALRARAAGAPELSCCSCACRLRQLQLVHCKLDHTMLGRALRVTQRTLGTRHWRIHTSKSSLAAALLICDDLVFGLPWVVTSSLLRQMLGQLVAEACAFATCALLFVYYYLK